MNIKNESTLESLIREALQEMRKPRQICVCGKFQETLEYEMDFTRCRNCRGWMSAMRIMNNDV